MTVAEKLVGTEVEEVETVTLDCEGRACQGSSR